MDYLVKLGSSKNKMFLIYKTVFTNIHQSPGTFNGIVCLIDSTNSSWVFILYHVQQMNIQKKIKARGEKRGETLLCNSL